MSRVLWHLTDKFLCLGDKVLAFHEKFVFMHSPFFQTFLEMGWGPLDGLDSPQSPCPLLNRLCAVLYWSPGAKTKMFVTENAALALNGPFSIHTLFFPTVFSPAILLATMDAMGSPLGCALGSCGCSLPCPGVPRLSCQWIEWILRKKPRRW